MLMTPELAWICLALTGLITTSRAASYDEHLLLRPLPEASLLGSFNFRSSISESSFRSQNFGTFPRSLGQILLHSHTEELHLRFSTGRWDSETWGARPWNGTKEGGTGVELWAWMEAESDEQANARWLTLTNALSGLFCASLNFIDATRSIRPVAIFQHEGNQSSIGSGTTQKHLLHGMLPNEVVCTENLTPFLKLLPCKGKAGISSLLDGHKLFDASWQTMAIDVQRNCQDPSGACEVEVQQTVDMVLNLDRAKRSRDDPIPRPVPVEQLNCDESKDYRMYGDACMPLPPPSKPAFTVTEVFGRPVRGTCPTIGRRHGSAPIRIDVVSEQHVSIKSSAAYKKSLSLEGQQCFTPESTDDFDIAFSSASSEVSSGPVETTQQPLIISRTLTGRGQQHGGLLTTFRNPSPREVTLVYLETLPWFLKPHYHTLRSTSTIGGEDSTWNRNLRESSNIVDSMFYRPAVDRTRASHLEAILRVQANSTLTLTYEFEKAILRYTEYPPDANRGFDIAPAIVKVFAPGQENVGVYDPDSRPSYRYTGKGTYMRTTSLLLYLPTPDFSMPYNVIILTSTVIALAFGSIYNVLVRRFVAADEVPKNVGLKSKIQAALGKLRSKIASLSRKTKAE